MDDHHFGYITKLTPKNKTKQNIDAGIPFSRQPTKRRAKNWE
jgi:hypothetical protein